MKTTISHMVFTLAAAVFCSTPTSKVSAAPPDYLITYTDLKPPGSGGGGLRFTSGTWQGGSIDGRATIWSGPAHTAINLHPGSATSSEVLGGAGNQQVGYTYSTFAWASFAAIWNGSMASHVNLNPSWSLHSMALATTGTRQVGYATTAGFQVRAGLWSGTAASFVDLHPVTGNNSIISSTAYAIAGNQQGGMVNYNGFAHAALWSGTAASYRNIHPGGEFSHSEIFAMTTSQQVGYAGGHAGLWFGTAESFVDLHPEGAAFSEARATVDTMQAGFAVLNSYRHALLWFGSADNYIDLQLALGSQYRESEAHSIWTDGSTILVAGHALDWPGSAHPVLWRLQVPEPAMGSILALALGVLATQRRHQKWTR